MFFTSLEQLPNRTAVNKSAIRVRMVSIRMPKVAIRHRAISQAEALPEKMILLQVILAASCICCGVMVLSRFESEDAGGGDTGFGVTATGLPNSYCPANPPCVL